MQWSRRAVDHIGHEIGEHESDRSSNEAHGHDSKPLSDSQSTGRGQDATSPCNHWRESRSCRERDPTDCSDRTHHDAGQGTVSEQLGQSNRHDRLEGDHAESPKRRYGDQRFESARSAQQGDTFEDGTWDISERRSKARMCHSAFFLHEDDDARHGKRLRDDRGDDRDGQCLHAVQRVPGDQAPRSERARTNSQPDDRSAASKAHRDVGFDVMSMRFIDKPRIERTAVERPIDPHQRGCRAECERRLCKEKDDKCEQTDTSGQDQYRLAPPRVSQSAGGKFKSQGDKPLHREGRTHLRNRQATVQRQQRHRRNDQPGRKPARPEQDEIGAPNPVH